MRRFCFLLGFGLLCLSHAFAAENSVKDNPLASEDLEVDQPSDRPRTVKGSFVLPRLDSPEATWESFHAVMAIYSKILIEEGYTQENYHKLMHIEKRLTEFFDLREVPPSVQRTSAVEASVYLYEAFARFADIGPGVLPGRDQAFAQMKAGYPDVWTIEDGIISIIFVTDGQFRGNFQFSYRTLKAADVVYEAVKDLSYINESVEGLHDAYFLTPGPLIPAKIINALPSWMHVQFVKQSVWQWVVMIGLILFEVLVIIYAMRLLALLARHLPPVLRSLSRLAIPVLLILLTQWVVNFLAIQVFITGEVLRIVRFVEWMVFLLAAVILVFVLGNIISEIVIKANRFEKKGIDSSLIRFAFKVGSILVAAAVLIEGATMLGFTLTTVLAGAGVTGLAIALAAQESLRNVFGSVMLLLDKPFKVGQRVLVRGHDGVVESIGLRSTKIRLLTGHLTAIPNEDVAKADIENVGERPSIRRLFRLPLSIQTPPEKVDEALDILRGLLSPNSEDEDKDWYEMTRPINQEEFSPKVFFEGMGQYAFEIIIIFWYFPAVYWDYMALNEAFNRRLIRALSQAGINLAVPTQTNMLMSVDSNGSALKEEGAAKAFLATLPGGASGPEVEEEP